MASVRRRGQAVVATLDAEESQLLRLLAEDLRALLGEHRPPAGGDPLAAVVRLPEQAPAPPADPALARLLPDGYGAEEPDAAAELRRLTEDDLRETKRAAARTLVETLPDDGGGRIRLGADDAGAWLRALNDLRLVLGTRLDVTEEMPPLGGHRPDDPAAAPYVVYDWLTGLQDALVSALMP